MHHHSDQRESRFSRILENFFENSLLDLDFESFDFHFHFSISILIHLIFTFTSRKEWKEKIFHFSFLENGEIISYFTLFIKENEWNWVQFFMDRLGIFLHQQLNSSISIFGSFKIQQRTIQKSVFFWTLLSQIMNLISKLLVKSRLLSAKRAEATEFTSSQMHVLKRGRDKKTVILQL